ncbi:hypothetical protein CEUSTIGMA_g3477.t1 [Chlamydomonas eustigma]|uniref:Uncharacterized protein n=1 Tax=Chlamydomonas eustigma TaxID=1157962 RepID=A0A250WYW2_9CHLO|nr:hypothetical protein CEUSTIGMA_g3477.t1 [Chlamydomonas eustigma]|eukprot:GAX76034.1 hypothetical protein CEUSTIGMA_g3477.t1 [Chlamydomonas eustigma]
MAEACLTLFKDKLGPGNRHHPLYGEDSLPNSLSETSATVIKQEARLNEGRLAPINRNVRSRPSWELRRGSRSPRDSRVDELCRQALMLTGGLSHQLCSKGEMMDGQRLDVQLSKSDWLLWSTSFETATLSGIKRASARDLAFSTVALASMKVSLSSQWLDTLGSRTAELLCTSVQTAHAARDDAPTASSQNSVSAVMAPTFSSLVHLSAAAAALGCKVDSTSLAACTEAGGIASATNLRRLPPVILADLSWALVVMGGRPDPMWAAAFLDSSHCCIVCMSPQQLIRCLQTLVLLGLKPYDLWLRDMELRLLQSSCAGQASCEDIVTYLSCLKKIKRVPDFQTGTRLVHELKRLLPSLQHEEIQSIITTLKSLFPKMRDKGMKALTHEMARRCKELLHQDAP